jgi:hypothetical protein
LFEARIGQVVLKWANSGTLLASDALVGSSDLTKLALVARSAYISVIILLGFVAFTEANSFVNILFLDGIIRFAFGAEIL